MIIEETIRLLAIIAGLVALVVGLPEFAWWFCHKFHIGVVE